MRSYWQISVALGVAIKETGRTNFTDSKAGVKIQNEHLVDQREKELRDYGPSLIIRWVPGHAKIERNERADSAAKDVTQEERIETNGWGSFTHTKTELKIIQNSRTLYMAPARGGSCLSKPKKWHRRNARKDVKKLCSPLLPT